jgi:hypothetical protein
MGLRVFRWAGLSGLLAVGLAVSACGSPPGSETAAQIVPEMQAAADAASSVHVTGAVTKGQQVTTIDVSINGNSVAGYLGSYGTRFYVLSLNGLSYVKLNAAFLSLEKAPASLCATICGKYVELTSSSAPQITALLSMQQLDQQIFNNSNMSSVSASGCVFSPTTRGSQSVLECRQGTSTIDVAAHGQPYLVYWSGPNGQHLAFSDWNSAVLPSAPPTSQVVSLSSLGAG